MCILKARTMSRLFFFFIKDHTMPTQRSLLGLRRHTGDFGSNVVRLQEIPSGSMYKNSSKNRAKLSLVLDIFSSAIMNDLSTTLTSRLKVDAKCVYQQ